MRRYGLIENSARGVWAPTAAGQQATAVTKEAVKMLVQEEEKQRREEKKIKEQDDDVPDVLT